MRVIGLTGGIASGKSLVSRYLRELGAIIIDCDQVARDVVRTGSSAWRQIVQEFGETVCKPDGSLDREALGRIVFSDTEKLDKLNRITHPYIISEIRRLFDDYRKNFPDAVVVLDAPLLLEVGLEGMVDEVWVVYVDYQTQLERLMKRDGFSSEEAACRISSQIPLEEKVKLADHVIDNRGDPEETFLQVRRLWNSLRCNK
ncbi:MAG TPA: dephospho-CoA kinase [Syntrophomonadaceae bacterium]|nr:dephospho-CoA kinase [Syntrophomonadaceae bacterium]